MAYGLTRMETEQIETLIDYKIKGRGEKMSSSFSIHME
ncbi:hypothetical protein bcere0027_10630 [Bacillus cereus AH676]|nr:hypothetical protein FORC24_1053 [Bacillus cereus]EEL77573.1 hypothetical protein bcere0027_10630 [Bacillus cereus AH676]